MIVGRNLDGDLVFPTEPAAQVDQLAAIAAEREVAARLVRRGFGHFFLADGAEHGGE